MLPDRFPLIPAILDAKIKSFASKDPHKLSTVSL